MAGWFRRTWRRFRDESAARAVRAGGHELAAGTIGRAASGLYGHRAEPTAIWERDWDVLCLLDGCRIDLFRETASDGTYDFLPPADAVGSIWSVGSQSAEWMAETFGPEYADEMAQTAYVSGNPFTAQSGDQLAAVETDPLPLAAGDFGALYEAWRDEWTDGDISTIPPEPLTDTAVATWRRRDELGVDRVIVHYMQPHTPFRSRPDWFLGTADIEDWGQLDDGDGSESDTGNGDAEEAEDDLVLEDIDEETRELLEALDSKADVGRDPWTRLRDGELPAAEFWTAYRDNLAWVLDDVGRLVENCDGTIALSSDHGNAAGEFGVWSHPPAVHLPALREVPWVTVAGDDRRTADPPLPDDIAAASRGAAEDVHRDVAAGDDAVEQRLADLGYR